PPPPPTGPRRAPPTPPCAPPPRICAWTGTATANTAAIAALVKRCLVLMVVSFRGPRPIRDPSLSTTTRPREIFRGTGNFPRFDLMCPQTRERRLPAQIRTHQSVAVNRIEARRPEIERPPGERSDRLLRRARVRGVQLERQQPRGDGRGERSPAHQRIPLVQLRRGHVRSRGGKFHLRAALPLNQHLSPPVHRRH